jgi:hypothetical protein
MTIEKVLVCDACKQPINDNKLDAISVLGNIHKTDCNETNGFGGRLFGDCNWLAIANFEAIDYCEIPVTHVHLKCLIDYLQPKLRQR